MRTNDRGGTRFGKDLPSPVGSHPADVLLTPERAAKYRQVLARRCQSLAVVIEDCHDPHNATAVMRTCDATGVMRVHVVARRSAFRVNRRVSQGAHRYLDLRVHEYIEEAYEDLRRDGYRIAVSDLAQETVLGIEALGQHLQEHPLALVFGSEAAGVSRAASAGADCHFLVPMAGFSESLNLSVSVAMSLYALRREALRDDAPGDLDPERQCWWYDRWVRAHKGAAVDSIAARFREEQDRHGESLDVVGGSPTE